MKTKQRKTITIDGINYYPDRPCECYSCFFWKNRKIGCILGKENCYYLAETPKSEQEKKCENCSYAKGQPCVTGSCYKELGNWLRERRERVEYPEIKREGVANA